MVQRSKGGNKGVREGEGVRESEGWYKGVRQHCLQPLFKIYPVTLPKLPLQHPVLSLSLSNPRKFKVPRKNE